MPNSNVPTDSTTDTLANRFMVARKRMGISQAELARRVGVSPQAIQQLERGSNKSSRRLVEIADALRVRPDWLQLGRGEMTNGMGGHDDLLFVDVLTGVLTALEDTGLPPQDKAKIFVYMLNRLKDVSPEVRKEKAEEWSREVTAFTYRFKKT